MRVENSACQECNPVRKGLVIVRFDVFIFIIFRVNKLAAAAKVRK
jgi:hypothetical protein